MRRTTVNGKPSLTDAAQRALAGTNGTPAPSAPINNASMAIPLDRIFPSPLNPRKTFDAEKLAELAASLRSVGVLQPVLVRLGHGSGRYQNYELVDGERRFRAAELAELDTIPAIVRDLTDRQVLEIAFVTCEQREDVSPLEKAAGYRKLIEEHGVSLEDLAGQIGRSVSTIRGLLKLPQLPGVARAALAAGEISLSTALLIARVPGERQRLALAHHVLHAETGWYGEKILKSGLPKGRVRKGGRLDALSFRETKALIEEHLMRELKQAPFSRQALDLVEAAGSCDACPKRTGNAPEEFSGARADVCTDTACYQAKVQAHAEKIVAHARAQGKKVIEGAAAEPLFSSHVPSNLRHDAPWVDLKGELWIGSKQTTYQKRFGKELAAEVVLAVDPEGGVHRLLSKARVEAELRKERSTGGGGDDGWKRRQRAADQMAKLHKRAALVANAAVVARMRQELDCLAGVTPTATELIRAALLTQVQESWADSRRIVERARGLATEGKHKGPQAASSLAELIPTLPAVELLTLWAELVAARASLQWSASYSSGPKASPFWTAFGIQPASIVQRVKTEARAKASKPNGKKGKKGKAVAADPGDDGGSDEDDAAEPDQGEPAEGAAIVQDVADREENPVVQARLNRIAADLRGDPASWRHLPVGDLGFELPADPAYLKRMRKIHTAGELADAIEKDAIPWLGEELCAKLRAHFAALAARAVDQPAAAPPPGADDWSDLAVGARVQWETDPEKTGTIVARRNGQLGEENADVEATWHVEWDRRPGQRKPERGWHAGVNLLPILTRKPAPPVQLDTPLVDLAHWGGVDAVVGYTEMLAALEPFHVRTAGDLLGRARRMFPGSEFESALYAALRSVVGVSAGMAQRVAHWLEDLLRPLAGDPDRASTFAARAKARTCSKCQRTDEADLVWATEELCADCHDAEVNNA